MDYQQASIIGTFKTAMFFIGAFFLLRLIGRLMIARRNIETERQMLEREKKFQRERGEKLKNFGKVNVAATKSSAKRPDAEDVDFEEIK